MYLCMRSSGLANFKDFYISVLYWNKVSTQVCLALKEKWRYVPVYKFKRQLQPVRWAAFRKEKETVVKRTNAVAVFRALAGGVKSSSARDRVNYSARKSMIDGSACKVPSMTDLRATEVFARGTSIILSRALYSRARVNTPCLAARESRWRWWWRDEKSVDLRRGFNCIM